MGGNKVTNIAKGEAGTDAVNVDQLTELANKPLNFTADSGADLDRKLGEKVGINGADSNITTETTPTGVQIALATTLDLGQDGSIRLGHTMLPAAGTTTTGGPRLTQGGSHDDGTSLLNREAEGNK